MKSRNLKAIFASVLTVALLATAMTGFAATVTTTSTYNAGDGKVAVVTNVTDATANSEVTYLVKNGEGDIVYIDQDTAANGAVSFEYKIAQNKIADYATTVKFGTDASDALLNMFTGTGGKFKGTPNINTIYYVPASAPATFKAYVKKLNGGTYTIENLTGGGGFQQIQAP